MGAMVHLRKKQFLRREIKAYLYSSGKDPIERGNKMMTQDLAAD